MGGMTATSMMGPYITVYTRPLPDAEEEEGRVNPGQPLGLQGNDEEEQDGQVGEQGGHGEEEGHVQVVRAVQDGDRGGEASPETGTGSDWTGYSSARRYRRTR